MSFSAGNKLGAYEILSSLGAGGMGEVYRARDSKLNREVALKVLLPGLATIHSPPPAESLQIVYYPASAIAISPDGSEIIYAGPSGGDRLRRRRLESQDLQTIPGTEGAQQPFCSPNGEWLAFFSDDGTLKKMPARGGRPVIVVRDLAGAGWSAGSWSDTDQIVFDNWAHGLSIVSNDGGNRRKLIDGGDEMPLVPVVLPGSRTTVFTCLRRLEKRAHVSGRQRAQRGGDPSTRESE